LYECFIFPQLQQIYTVLQGSSSAKYSISCWCLSGHIKRTLAYLAHSHQISYLFVVLQQFAAKIKAHFCFFRTTSAFAMTGGNPLFLQFTKISYFAFCLLTLPLLPTVVPSSCSPQLCSSLQLLRTINAGSETK